MPKINFKVNYPFKLSWP